MIPPLSTLTGWFSSRHFRPLVAGFDPSGDNHPKDHRDKRHGRSCPGCERPGRGPDPAGGDWTGVRWSEGECHASNEGIKPREQTKNGIENSAHLIAGAGRGRRGVEWPIGIVSWNMRKRLPMGLITSAGGLLEVGVRNFLTLQHGFMVRETLPSQTNPMVSLLLPCINNCSSHYNSPPDTVALTTSCLAK